eukprot:tig00001537_g9300.t1
MAGPSEPIELPPVPPAVASPPRASSAGASAANRNTTPSGDAALSGLLGTADSNRSLAGAGSQASSMRSIGADQLERLLESGSAEAAGTSEPRLPARSRAGTDSPPEPRRAHAPAPAPLPSSSSSIASDGCSSGELLENGGARPAEARRRRADPSSSSSSASSSSSSSSGEESGAGKAKRKERKEEARYRALLDSIRAIVRKDDHEDVARLRRECEELQARLNEEQKKREKAEKQCMVERVLAQEGERMRAEAKAEKVEAERLRGELAAARADAARIHADLEARPAPSPALPAADGAQDGAEALRTELVRAGEALELERHQAAILEADRIALATRAQEEAARRSAAEAALAHAAADARDLRARLDASEARPPRAPATPAPPRRSRSAGLGELRTSAGVAKHEDLASRLLQAEAAIENLRGEVQGYRAAYGPLPAEAASPRTRATAAAAGVRSVGGHAGPGPHDRAAEELLESLRRDGAITPLSTPPAGAAAAAARRKEMSAEEAELFQATLARIDKTRLLLDYKHLLRANADLARELDLQRAAAARLRLELDRLAAAAPGACPSTPRAPRPTPSGCGRSSRGSRRP